MLPFWTVVRPFSSLEKPYMTHRLQPKSLVRIFFTRITRSLEGFKISKTLSKRIQSIRLKLLGKMVSDLSDGREKKKN